MRDPAFVLLLADMHVGAYWAIWHPEYEMKRSAAMDRGTCSGLNDYNEPIWGDWRDMCHRLEATPPNVVILGGDLIDGSQALRMGGELYTDKADWQIECCIKLLRMIPVAKNCEIYSVASSPYHDIKFFSAMCSVKNGWKEIKPERARYLGRTGIVTIRGHSMRVYHGKSQAYVYREMLRARARMFAAETMAKGKIPSFEAIINAHWHNWMHIRTSWTGQKDFQLVQIPCWQGQTDLAAWQEPDKLIPDIGYAYATVTEESLTFDRHLYPTPLGISQPVISRA